MTAIGSTRQMAAEVVTIDPNRPRWLVGVNAAVCTFSVLVIIAALCALAWVDGVMAADEARATVGTITLFPGSVVDYAPRESGFQFGFSTGWLPLAAALLSFVIAARPWRLLRQAQGREVHHA